MFPPFRTGVILHGCQDSYCQAAREKKGSVTVGFKYGGPLYSLGLTLGVSFLFIVQQFPRAFSALIRPSDTARKHHPHGC